MTSSPYPDLGRFDSEKYYEDPDKSEKLKFPSIHDPPSMDLSVVVPAYNEEERCKIHVYSRTSMARTPLGPGKLV